MPDSSACPKTFQYSKSRSLFRAADVFYLEAISDRKVSAGLFVIPSAPYGHQIHTFVTNWEITYGHGITETLGLNIGITSIFHLDSLVKVDADKG